MHACGETTPRVDSVALDAIDAAPKRRNVATMAWRLTPSTRPPNDTGTAPAAASRRDSRSKSASERAAASTRACDASATAAACDVHGASRASRRRAAAVRAALTYDDGEGQVIGFIGSVKPTKKPHARHSGDHTQTHWWHRRRQKNGKEGTWKQTAEQAGYWMGLVAVALFILIGYAYHTKLSEEERKDKCAPCRAALLTVTNRDTAVMDEAEQALGLKASKD